MKQAVKDKPANPAPSSSPRKPMPAPADDFLARLNGMLQRRSKMWLLISLISCFVLGGMLFDPRMSFSTDDATYISNSMAFLKHGSYPTYQGALWPLWMAMLIKIFGMKLLLLKFSSLFLLLGQVVFLYLALKDRVPALAWISCLLVCGWNAYLLAYGSSTYSEAMFMFMQSVMLFATFRLMDRLEAPGGESLKNTIGHWLFFAVSLCLLSITRTVAVFAVAALAIHFLFRKEWKNAAISLLSFGLVRGLYEVIAKYVFHKGPSGQMEQLMRKEFYNPAAGYVDFGDLVTRGLTNFGNYISIHVFKVLGLRGSGISSLYLMEKSTETQMFESSTFLSLVFLVLAGIGLYYSFRNNKYVFFTMLYVGMICFITFGSLQVEWNQDRYMIIVVMLMLMSFVYGLIEFIRHRRLNGMQPVLPILAAVCLIIQLVFTIGQVNKNRSRYKQAMRGEMFDAYSPETANMLRAAAWAGENLDMDKVNIAADRNLEDRVYAKSLSISKMPNPKSGLPDSVYAMLKEYKITHILAANSEYPGQSAKIAQFLQQAFPDRLKVIYTESPGYAPASIIEVK